MARNPHGTLTKGNLEWGRTHRKEEDRLRGLNNRGRRQAIEDQLPDDDDSQVLVCETCGRFNCLFDANSYDDGPEALDWDGYRWTGDDPEDDYDWWSEL